MRGKIKAQPEFCTVINLNQRVALEHPLRGIKQRVDTVMQKLSPLFDELYAKEGRPSIPPEQLLKSRVLIALYSVRSERLFCEQLGYNLLWLWFLDRDLEDGSFDPTVFTHNSERVLSAEAAKLFFVEVYELSQAEGWTSDQHFTTDGTLIEAWASLKSFVRKDGKDEAKVQSAKDDEHRQLHEAKISTVGADKAYHQQKFVGGCRERGISPHVACKEQIKVKGLDRRTTGASGYQSSQKLRKRVEEIFGWMKTVGG